MDFRAGINSLAVLVQETMALDPFTPAVFAFCNRRLDRMKLLFFDRSGFVLVLKRLTEDKFRWPRRQEAVVTLTTGLDAGLRTSQIRRRHHLTAIRKRDFRCALTAAAPLNRPVSVGISGAIRP
ncbi:IS66 family insertion sequence element accessory protein TnpB [Rhizobium mongolense]|uniref:IS66 family insertion sequence element accessory protein TnpB n=1 Tax=Rhizobium mongolense TaxID=57676 RepID=UPI0035580114